MSSFLSLKVLSPKESFKISSLLYFRRMPKGKNIKILSQKQCYEGFKQASKLLYKKEEKTFITIRFKTTFFVL